MGLETHMSAAVAIVVGGATLSGRAVARELASWAWAVVIVYLDHQPHAEEAVAEVIAAGGAGVAVRADIADDLDVQRLFTESAAVFGVVDVVVDLTTGSAGPLYEHAATHVRDGGVVVSVSGGSVLSSALASRMRERGIRIARVPPGSVLDFLERWRHHDAAGPSTSALE